MMADTLTKEERDAIASFPDERVQRVPMGMTTAAEHFRWVKRPGKTGGYLRSERTLKLTDRIRAAVAQTNAHKRRMGL